MDKAIYIILGLLIGAFPICAAIFDWDWFFNNHRAKPFVWLLGRKGARIFYAGLGIFIIGLIIFIGIGAATGILT